MNITLMAHDKKKELMVQFCTAYKSVLSKHNLSATATTGRLVAEATGLPVTLYLSHNQGGHQQVDARIAYNEIDLVLLFTDPNNSDPWEDQQVVQTLHLCDAHNVPMATNLATAEYAYKRQVDAQADAMVAMAKNPNGGMNSMAGMGMQMSAGMAFGGMMAGQMNGGVQGQSGTQKESFVICQKCGSEMKKGLKFCSECGALLVVQKKKCIKCGAEINADMKFCPECGANQVQPVCPKCGYKAAAGQKFCPECGTSLL